MARTLTKWIVEDMVRSLADAPDACILLNPQLVPKTGPVRVLRDGKRWSLHRYLLYRDTGLAPDPAVCLLPGGCTTQGCLNPYHMVQSRRRGRPLPTVCPNGHPYVTSNIVRKGNYKCRTCYENAKARRRRGAHGHGWCRQGHRLAGGNVYRWVDANGKRHRRCRRCQIERQRAYRQRKEQG